MLTVTKGLVSQGRPLDPRAEDLVLPREILSASEEVYRVLDGSLVGIAEAGDLLIVERRTHAATGELVLVEKGGKHFVGRWWQKHGRRDVLDPDGKVLVRKPRIVGAVNLIIRGIA